MFTHTLMKPSYFVNDRLYLRAVEPEDLQVLYAIENDPQSWDISNFTVPYSKYVLKQYIENSQCDMFADKQLRLMIVRKSDRQVLGTVDITDFVPASPCLVQIRVRDESELFHLSRGKQTLKREGMFIRPRAEYGRAPGMNGFQKTILSGTD